jgi:cyanate lyase
LSFEKLAKAVERDEIWVAAAFYGQVRFRATLSFRSMYNRDRHPSPIQAKLTPEEIEAFARVLDIPLVWIQNEIGSYLSWWPNRGLGPIPPTDPVIYRLYEVRTPFQAG